MNCRLSVCIVKGYFIHHLKLAHTEHPDADKIENIMQKSRNFLSAKYLLLCSVMI